MGGLSWFAIPWLCATTMGLAALALESNPIFPSYPNRMAPADVSAGLVVPYAAVALLGSGGAVATLLIVFMAVTSAFSAQLIAVSSIFTYDVYQTYVNPSASGKRLIYMSHSCVLAFGMIMAGLSTGFFYAGISMGYLYLLMGVIISAAVLPATLTLMWSGQNKWAATLTPPLGLCCSLIAWLVTASKQSGEITVESTGANDPMLAGNVVALLSPLIFIPLFTLIFGLDHYDWQSMKDIKRGDDSELSSAAGIDVETVPGHAHQTPAEYEEEMVKLNKASKIAKTMTAVLTVCLLVLWPLPMYGSGYVFSEKFFAGWISVGIFWLFCSTFCVGLYPLWEGRKSLIHTFSSMFKDLTGKKNIKTIHAEAREVDRDESGTNSPKKSFTQEKVDNAST